MGCSASINAQPQPEQLPTPRPNSPGHSRQETQAGACHSHAPGSAAGHSTSEDTAQFQPTRDVWNCAVSLAWLQQFALSIPEHYTTADVTEQIIKPATAQAKCRYVDLIERQEQNVGQAHHFISHRWGCLFREALVAPLLHHFAGQDPIGIKVWLDIFAVNQHPNTSQEDDLANLQGVIKVATSTLMVLDVEALVLTRIWCLYEAWKTAEHLGASGLQLLAYRHDISALQAVFIDLDVAKAQATVAADRDRILSEIHASMGAPALNAYLKCALVASAEAGVSRLEADGVGGLALAIALDKAGRLLQFSGRVSEAAAPLARALEIYEAAAAAAEAGADAFPEHVFADLARSLNNMATLLQAQGRLEEAEAMFRRALAQHERVHGEVHPEVVAATSNLAMALREQGAGRLQEAELLLRRALGHAEVCSPEAVPQVLANLALVVKLEGRLEQARPLYRLALQVTEKVKGPNHPDTATVAINLSMLLQSAGQFDEAEPLLRRAFATFESVLGPDHPTTASALSNLSMMVASAVGPAEAEPLMRRAVEARDASLGPAHPDTLLALDNLALLLMQQGKREEAEAALRRTLIVREAAAAAVAAPAPGAARTVARRAGSEAGCADANDAAAALAPDAVRKRVALGETLMRLAGLVKDMPGRRAEARQLVDRALLVFESTLGPEHESTVMVRQLQAQLLEQAMAF